MDRIIKLLKSRATLDITQLKTSEVKAGVKQRMHQLGIQNIDCYVKFAETTPLEDIPLYLNIFVQSNPLLLQQSVIEIVLEHIPAMLIAIDSNQKITAISNFWLSKSGFEKSEIVGKKISSFIDVGEDRIDEICQYIHSTDHRQIEIPFKTKDQNPLHNLVTSVTLSDERLESSLVVLVAQDISLLKEAEQKLHDAIEENENIKRTIPSILFHYDIELGETQYLNNYIYEFLGVDQNSGITGNELFNMAIHPEDREELQLFKHEQYNADFLFKKDIRLKGIDGNYKWFGIYERVYHFTSNGKPAKTIGVAIDIHEQKIQQKQLQKSERHLRAMLDGDLYTYYLLDLDYKVLALNKKAKVETAELLGHQFSQGTNFLDFVPDDQKDGFKQNFATCLSGTAVSKRIQVAITEEHRRWYDVYFAPAKNSEGEIFAVSFSSTDVSEEEERNEALRLSESRYTNVIDAIGAGVWEIDLMNNANSASPYFYEMLGYSKDEFPFKNDLYEKNFIHPEDKAKRRKALNAAIEGNDIYKTEYRVKTSNGYRWFRVNGKVIHDKSGKPVRIIGSIIDIHDQLIAQLKLTERDQLLNSINTNISEGLYRSTTEGTLVYANAAFFSLMGYSEDEVRAKAVRASQFYVNESDRKQLITELNSIGRVTNKEVHFTRKDGSTFWALLSSMKVVSPQGTVYFDGAIRDITDIRKTNLELEVAKNQAEEMNRLKSSFLANMSHEIRTPINGILGVAELVQMADDLEETKEYAKIIAESGTRLLNTITSILDLSRLEAKAGDFSARQIELNTYIKKTIPLYDILVQKKSLQLTTNFNAQDLVILAEESMLDQVLNNLIGNAIKFTASGEIRVTTDLIEKSGRANMVQFEVEDTGVGISVEFLPKLFDPFQQESSGTNRKFEGSGLGLSICKKYIELLGGSIEVWSKQNKGSTFRVRIPEYRS
jgi:PAS domain S-box-containing protein